MPSDDLQQLVDELAEQLHRSVAIDDPTVQHLLAASRHFGDEDELRVRALVNRSAPPPAIEAILRLGITRWTEPHRVDLRHVPGLDTRLAARFCVPIRCSGVLLGFLWLIDRDATLTREEIDAAVETAGRAGIALYRRLVRRTRSRARTEDLLAELVASDHDVRQRAVGDLRAEELIPDDATCFQVLATHHAPAEAPSAAQVALESATEEGMRALPAGTALMAAARTRAWLLLATAKPLDDERLYRVGARITSRYRAIAGSAARVGVGVGDPVGAVSEVITSHYQASVAARAALIVPSLEDVARWGKLGPYEILLRMPIDEMLRTPIPAIEALATGDSSGILTRTLEAYFDNACDARQTAELLCVHRATLYQRLHRIEQLTGCRFDRGDDRLALHLGVKLRALAASHRAELETEG
ncbi:helix-turn-helix domain-containing protein [Amycolatopsis jejuensis]|uniref:helix-turn-helix domain-containing protein n=1 Tax=Amycolatopsis jejuensis TaxID=330084 RepID=UPI000526C251|nr:helix-turn-helix domain-containing protein [Amycolatopsis jejuensis]